jgi:hypothetical protein
MSPQDKPIVWLLGEIVSPPFSCNARIEAGYLLPQIQKGMILILEASEKKTNKTPKSIIDVCKQRIKIYEKDIKGWNKGNE